MPFPRQEPQPFTEENISALCPMQMGVYGVFDAQGKCLYIGQTEDLRHTLLGHLRGQSYQAKDFSRNGAAFWMAAMVPFSQLDALEMLLDAEYRPLCNSWEARALATA